MKSKTVALYEVCNLVPGFAFKSENFGDYQDKVIKIGDIVPPDVDMEHLPGVDISCYNKDKLKQYLVSAGDYVLAMTGSTIGKVGRIRNGQAYINQRVLVFRPKDIIDSDYLYYVLSQPLFRQFVVNHADSETAKPNISASSTSKFSFSLPPIEIQRKIGGLLSALDDKIAINKAINKNLEKQVSSIYESWFENFDLNNGRCPDKWKYKTLADIACVSSGKRPQVKSEHFSASTPIPIIGAASVMGFTSKANYTDKILVTGRVGTHGIIQRFHAPCWTSDNTLVITSQYYEFTNQVLRRINYSSMNRGSTQPLITQSDMNKVTVLVPDKYDLLNFEKISGKLMNLYNTNNEENQRLAAIRDAFLPKLMSGEIDVSQVKI
ncbi:MAG: restriction endonuclease subunit S [Candidatus Bruticola sp.]